jgi:hypothetical protein
MTTLYVVARTAREFDAFRYEHRHTSYYQLRHVISPSSLFGTKNPHVLFLEGCERRTDYKDIRREAEWRGAIEVDGKEITKTPEEPDHSITQEGGSSPPVRVDTESSC